MSRLLFLLSDHPLEHAGESSESRRSCVRKRRCSVPRARWFRRITRPPFSRPGRPPVDYGFADSPDENRTAAFDTDRECRKRNTLSLYLRNLSHEIPGLSSPILWLHRCRPPVPLLARPVCPPGRSGLSVRGRNPAAQAYNDTAATFGLRAVFISVSGLVSPPVAQALLCLATAARCPTRLSSRALMNR